MTLSDDYLRGKDVGELIGRQEAVDTVWNESYGHPGVTGWIRISLAGWEALLEKLGVKQ